MCAVNMHQYVAVFVCPCQFVRFTLSEAVPAIPPLTKSAARSFRPRTVRTRMSGIMLMYQGMDEIKGTDCDDGQQKGGKVVQR